MSEVQFVNIGEFNYRLPKQPPKSEILYSNLKPEDQYWRREKDLPKFFFDYIPKTKPKSAYTRFYSERTHYKDGKLISLSHEDTDKLIQFQEREMRRRVEGVWFMNNGVPTYITGSHYFMLQWGAMIGLKDALDQHYGNYREFQRDVHYFIDLCKKDPDCMGGYMIKPKKSGLTQLLALDYLEEATRTKGVRMGMMSKALVPDCRDTNFVYFTYAYNMLPAIFKPAWKIKNLTRMFFEDKDNPEESYYTEVFAAATVVDAFDGPKMHRVWLDEFPKYKSPSPGDVWTKTSETIKMQNIINGKIWISSYTPEDDSKSFEEASKLWDDSQLETRSDVTGRTISGLYTYFISSLDAYEGQYDKYGRTNKDEVKRIIFANRAQVQHDDQKLQANMRQYPITAQEAWARGGGGGSVFNNLRLGQRLDELKQIFNTGTRPWIEGYLRWKDNIRFGEVEFIEITQDEILQNKSGVFRVYQNEYLPTHAGAYNVPVRTQNYDSKGRLKPADDCMFIGASDPMDFVDDVDVVAGSQGAITNMILPSIALNTAHGKCVTNRMVLEYLHRPEDPRDYLEDLIMSMFYFGMYVLVESNKPWVIKLMKEYNLENFLLWNTPEKTIEPFDERKHNIRFTTKGGANDDSTVGEIVRKGREYLKAPAIDPITQLATGPDYLQMIYSERLIKDQMKFNPKKTKPFDLGMCWGLNLIAVDAYLVWFLAKNRKSSEYDKALLHLVMSKMVG